MEHGTGLVLRHETAAKPIIETFEHQKVLKQGMDVPEERPSFPIALTEVGIASKTIWVRLPEGRIPFDASLFVSLPAEFRGIHMSRMEEAISSLSSTDFADLMEYAMALAKKILQGQRGNEVHVKLQGLLPIDRSTLVSQRSSHDSLTVTASIGLVRKNDEIKIQEALRGIKVMHITACPCTQVYNRLLFNEKQTVIPLITHSQRSSTSLTMEDASMLLTYEDLLSCLNDALHLTQDLLKRPDEAELVLKAHKMPQFAEDAVRETARSVAIRFGKKLDPDIRVRIASVSLESIHIHDVVCRLDTTLRVLTDVAATL
ncbi:MAG: GTP cyclohydrolase, FolE2/MptA family [Dissulfuribacterales bacterium]